MKQFELPNQNVTDRHRHPIKMALVHLHIQPSETEIFSSCKPASCAAANMKTTCGRMLPVVAVLVALAVTAHAAAIGPPKRRGRGQEIHLFEATVRVPDNGVEDLEEYNYRLLAKVLSRLHGSRISPSHQKTQFTSCFFTLYVFCTDPCGVFLNLSVEAARSAMYENELGLFSAFITNNQARRLSSELNPY
jgi:hypothetical protein